MNFNSKKSLTMVAALAVAACTLAGTAWARGGGGGHMGGSHFGGSSNFARPMSNNMHYTPSYSNSMHHVNPGNFTNHVNMTNKSFKFPTNSFKSGQFKSGQFKNQFQKMGSNKFANSKNKFWKKYNGWGKWNHHWGWGIGWGWGCWDSPWCSWYLYDPIPVAEYVNPYCGCGGTVVDGTDYSMAIAQMPANQVDGDDSDAFAAARAAFLQGDLDTALNAISQAAAQMPHNRDVHQFHSLVLFARKDYCKAATVAHAVLEDGPGWNWDTLQTLFPSPDVYTGELRDLEHYVSEHPSQANVRFLLAYHYMMLNHADPARRQLAQAAQLESKDSLSARIVGGMSSADDKPNTLPQPSPHPVVASSSVVSPTPVATPSPVVTPGPVDMPEPVVPPGPAPADTDDPTTTDTAVTIRQTTSADPSALPVPPAPVAGAQASTAAAPTAPQPVVSPVRSSTLIGTWKASPEKNVQIELALRDNGTFEWKFTANGQSRKFSGKFQHDDKGLALARTGDGEAMEGLVKTIGTNGFQFRMKDAEADDPGLTFTRS